MSIARAVKLPVPAAEQPQLQQALELDLSAGELRLLRQIRHGVLADMLTQLS